MDKGTTLNVLDHGFVRYIDHLGTDCRIVEAARISYQSPSKGPEQDAKLVGYLMRNQHTSPFEQCSITFNIRMPIFVMRQFVRHRTFRLNEMSGRYSELPADFYVPQDWRAQDTKNKQGSVAAPYMDHQSITHDVNMHCGTSHQLYRALLDQGVAKELARMVLPVNIYTEIYCNCDLHNLMRFFRLRLDHHAQLEIRVFAEAMFKIFQELYPAVAMAYAQTVVAKEDADYERELLLGALNEASAYINRTVYNWTDDDRKTIDIVNKALQRCRG